jgi:hypothetical protein
VTLEHPPTMPVTVRAAAPADGASAALPEHAA